MSKLDFLTDDIADTSADEETPVIEQAEADGAQPPEQATPEAEPALLPEAQPQAPEIAPPAPTTPPGHVPLAALLDARDKAKEYERQIEQLRAQIPRPAQRVPDPIDQPEEYQAYQEQQVQNVVLNARLDMSEDMARTKYGNDEVDQARAAILTRMAQSPAYAQEVLSHRNPYEFVVQEHRRQLALEKIGDPSELDAFIAWKAAQAAPASPTAPAALAASPQRTAPPIPPRSLASAPSAGGLAVQVVDEDEGTVFAKKG